MVTLASASTSQRPWPLLAKTPSEGGWQHSAPLRGIKSGWHWLTRGKWPKGDNVVLVFVYLTAGKERQCLLSWPRAMTTRAPVDLLLWMKVVISQQKRLESSNMAPPDLPLKYSKCGILTTLHSLQLAGEQLERISNSFLMQGKAHIRVLFTETGTDTNTYKNQW